MDISGASNAYKQHQQIKDLLEQKEEVQKEIRLTDTAYKLAFVGTFIVYFIFVWMMYVADLWGFTTWLEQNLSEFAALIVYGVLAITLPLAMALIKEIGYKHFAKYPNPTHTVVLIVGVLALAGVVYESIASSSQQQHISTKAAEGSKTFAAVAGSVVTVGQSGVSSQIAAASQKVAQCEARLAAGKEKHCNGDKAKLAAFKDSQQAENAAASSANVAAIEAKSKAMADLKEDAYKPVFKSIRDTFGVTISTGVMIITLFVSVIFEISHLLLILFLGQKLNHLRYIKQALIQAESGYLQATGKTFKQADFKDESVLDMETVRGEQQAAPEPQPFGFTHNRTATAGSNAATTLFKYQQQAAPGRQPFGFTHNRKSGESLDAENRSKYPQTIVQPQGTRETLTYRDELRNDFKGFRDAPLDTKHPAPPENSKDSGASDAIQLPVIQLPVVDSDNSVKSTVYAMAGRAKVGQVIACPCCGQTFTKANKWHLFCSNNRKPRHDGGNCSDDWHNTQNPERLVAMQAKARKRKG